ncbi:MAG: hypothetical protein ACW99G_03455 [Candidatus Thorarchaeota archaeon]|jgi:hypothetical protein
MDLQQTFQKWMNRIKGKNSSTLYYTGVVLNYFDRLKLIAKFRSEIPKGWKIIAHHMTVNMGKAEEGPLEPQHVGAEVNVYANTVAINDRVMAVGVFSGVPSDNDKKHITIAVAPDASAKESNDLTDWNPIDQIKLSGIIKEVPREVETEPGKEKISRPQSAPAPDDPVQFVQALSGKPPQVIKMAMKGKFPQLSDEEIEQYVNQTTHS